MANIIIIIIIFVIINITHKKHYNYHHQVSLSSSKDWDGEHAEPHGEADQDLVSGFQDCFQELKYSISGTNIYHLYQIFNIWHKYTISGTNIQYLVQIYNIWYKNSISAQIYNIWYKYLRPGLKFNTVQDWSLDILIFSAQNRRMKYKKEMKLKGVEVEYFICNIYPHDPAYVYVGVFYILRYISKHI